jgi:hypothetical protein
MKKIIDFLPLKNSKYKNGIFNMRSILKNRKKGILVGNALSLMLGGLALVGLIILGVELYGSFSSQDESNAQEFLNSLNGKIKNLENGEVGNFAVRGLKDFSLVAFNKNEERPEKCFFDNCLCVCPNSGESGIIFSCQESGFCRKIEQERIQFSTAEGVFEKGDPAKYFGEKLDKYDAITEDTIPIFSPKNTNYQIFSGRNVYSNGEIVLINSKYDKGPDKVDAAILFNDRIYLFNEDKYYRYNSNNLKFELDGIISAEWDGVPSNLDGAYHDSYRKVVYFFKDSSYWVFDDELDKVVPDKNGNFQRVISKNWIGVPDNIDSVYYYSYGKVIFIKDNEYYLYLYLRDKWEISYDEKIDKWIEFRSLEKKEDLGYNKIIPLINNLMELEVRKDKELLFISDNYGKGKPEYRVLSKKEVEELR